MFRNQRPGIRILFPNCVDKVVFYIHKKSLLFVFKQEILQSFLRKIPRITKNNRFHIFNFGLLALIIALVFFPVKTASAFDLFGFHFGKKTEEKDNNFIDQHKYYKVYIYSADNVNNILQKKIITPKSRVDGINVVKNSSDLYIDQGQPTPSSVGLLTKAREDYQKILNGFYDEGYYGATISIRINGKEVADIAPETILPEKSQVIITVNPEQEYIFSCAVIHNYPNYKLDKTNDNRLQVKNDSFAVNNIAKAEYIFQAEADTIQKWRELGYATAKFLKRKIVANHKNHTICANIWIDPGPKCYYKDIIIENISPKPFIEQDFIYWMANLKKGEIYNPDQIEEARSRLAKLGVFQSLSIGEDLIDKQGALAIKIIVQERPVHRFGFGGTYSSTDGFGFTSYAIHRNLFKHAESFRFDLAVNNIATHSIDNAYVHNFLYSLAGTYTEPGMFRPNNDFVITLKNQRDNLNQIDTQSFIGQMGFVYKINPILSGYTYFNTARINTKIEKEKWRLFYTLGFISELLYDNRDSIANAHIGWYIEGIAEPFYEGHYGNFITRLSLEGRHYIPLDNDDKFVFAMRGKLGTLLGGPEEEIPSSFLFFAGGGNSVRGYDYHSIGIHDPKTGIMTGGRSLLENTFELRMQLFKSVGFTSFVDSAFVGAQGVASYLYDAKMGAGIGAYYLTAIGPLRLDLAWPLEKKKSFGVYISIGQTF